MPPLAAPDLIMARQRQILRALPWSHAPFVQAGGRDVELRPGRSYAKDCETLQCTGKWAGVRVRASDGSVARGFVPSDAVGTIAPALTVRVSYLGDDIVPDRNSADRLQQAFRRLKELGTPHVRITARLDEAGSLEASSLAAARASVLADMFGRQGVPFERIRRRDRMTSPDVGFPGAIVEIQRAAGG